MDTDDWGDLETSNYKVSKNGSKKIVGNNPEKINPYQDPSVKSDEESTNNIFGNIGVMEPIKENNKYG